VKTATASLHHRSRPIGERGIVLMTVFCRHHVACSTRWPDQLDHVEGLRLLLLKHRLESSSCGCVQLCTGCKLCDGYAA
jgi:hypothetical protein